MADDFFDDPRPARGAEHPPAGEQRPPAGTGPSANASGAEHPPDQPAKAKRTLHIQRRVENGRLELRRRATKGTRRRYYTDRQLINALERNNGNVTATAKDLKVTRKSVYDRRKSLNQKAAAPPPKWQAPPRKAPKATGPDGVKTYDAQRLRAKLVKHRERFTGKRTLPTVPGVQSLSIATRYIEGGRDRFLEMVQNAVLDRNAAAEKWWYVYADLTLVERIKVNFDDLCAASGVSPKDLILAVLGTEMEYGRDVAELIRAAAMPKVMGVLAKSAMKENDETGERDRARFLQSLHLLPTPKGATINLSANASAAASAALEPSVPSFLENMKAVRAPMQDTQQRLAAAQPAETFDVEAERVEAES